MAINYYTGHVRIISVINYFQLLFQIVVYVLHLSEPFNTSLPIYHARQSLLMVRDNNLEH